MTQYEVYQYTYEFGYGFNLINDVYNNVSERVAAEDCGLSDIAKNKSSNVFELTDALEDWPVRYGDLHGGYVSYGYPCNYADRIFEYCDEYASKKQDQEWYNCYNSDDEPRNDCGKAYELEYRSRELAFFSQEPSNAIISYYGSTNVEVYIEPDGFKFILLNRIQSFSLDDENVKNEIQLYKNECKIRGNFIKPYNGVVFIPFTPYNFKKALLDACDSSSKVLGNLRPLITSR